MSSEETTTESAIPVGVLYMAGAAFCFSIMSLLVKLVGQRLPVFQIVMARSVLMLTFAYAHLRLIGQEPWGSNRKLLLARGAVGFVALCCYYYAVTELPLADATVIHYLNPVITAVIAAVFLGEAIRPIEAGGILVSLAGVALIQQPAFLFGGASRLEPFPVVVALGAATFSAAAYVIVRRLRVTEHPIVIVFYFSLFAAPASVPLAAPSALMPVGIEWLALLGIGIVTYTAQVCLTNGLHRVQAGRATAILYTQIVFAFGWDMVIFRQFPTALSLTGVALIVGSALTIAWLRARRK